MDKKTLTDHVTGALLGAVIGDALGRPSEGLTPWQVVRKYNFIDGFYSVNGQVGKFSDDARNCLLLVRHMAGSKTVSGESIRTFLSKDRNFGFLTKTVPLGLAAAILGLDDPQISGIIKEAKFYTEKHEALAIYLVCVMIRECIKNYSSLTRPFDLYDSENSLLNKHFYNSCMVAESGWVDQPDSLAERMRLVYTKLMDKSVSPMEFSGINGRSASHFECVPLSFFAFLNEPDEFKTVYKVASLGGSSSLNAALTGAFVGGYLGASYLHDIKNEVAESARIHSDAVDLVESLWVNPLGEESDPTEEYNSEEGAE